MVNDPYDDDSITHHIKRANYLAYIQRHPDIKRHPSPIGHGWELVNGFCKPVWHTQPALPISLSVPSQVDYDSNSDFDFDSEADSEAVDSFEESDWTILSLQMIFVKVYIPSFIIIL